MSASYLGQAASMASLLARTRELSCLNYCPAIWNTMSLGQLSGWSRNLVGSGKSGPLITKWSQDFRLCSTWTSQLGLNWLQVIFLNLIVAFRLPEYYLWLKYIHIYRYLCIQVCIILEIELRVFALSYILSPFKMLFYFDTGNCSVTELAE